MSAVERRGFHGIVVRASDPEACARRWTELAGFSVLRRSRSEIVLGAGPELFVSIRRARAGELPGILELHLAVEKLRATRRRGEKDALGGISWRRELTDGVALVVREFTEAPKPRWKKPRPKKSG